ncbi:hypothetical protein H632_c3965p0, partial [Helicosporidium sp. ATCC 50920]
FLDDALAPAPGPDCPLCRPPDGTFVRDVVNNAAREVARKFPELGECTLYNQTLSAGPALQTSLADNVYLCCATCQMNPFCAEFAYCPNPDGCSSKYNGQYPYRLCIHKGSSMQPSGKIDLTEQGPGVPWISGTSGNS